MVRSLADRTFQLRSPRRPDRRNRWLVLWRVAVGPFLGLAKVGPLWSDHGKANAMALLFRKWVTFARIDAVQLLVERFDIEPFPDFSAK